MAGVEFGIYLPQVGLTFPEILDRARTCERLGFDSLWMYDHFYSPGLPDRPSFEGFTLATALLARTSRLRVGHLVLCNNFRHPALLGKMVTTLDVISEGRVELGIGSGSVELEHAQAGIAWGSPAERSTRLGESLEILTRMFAGPVTTFDGTHYAVRDLPNLPAPVQRPRPPIHVGGAGPKRTLPLAARYADVWNVPTYALDRLDELSAIVDAECERIGRDPASLRRSIEAVLVTAPDGRLREAEALARRRFGSPGFGLDAGGFVGPPARITERVGELVEAGFSSFVFFTHDRADADTLALVSEEVAVHFPRLRSPRPAD